MNINRIYSDLISWKIAFRGQVWQTLSTINEGSLYPEIHFYQDLPYLTRHAFCEAGILRHEMLSAFIYRVKIVSRHF